MPVNMTLIYKALHWKPSAVPLNVYLVFQLIKHDMIGTIKPSQQICAIESKHELLTF